MSFTRAAGALGLILLHAPIRCAPAPPAASFLLEPDYSIEESAGKWVVKKPAFKVFAPSRNGSHDAWVIYEDFDRAAAESMRAALPRLRLSRPLMDFNPLTRDRRLITNWTGQGDARETEADIFALLEKNAPEAARTLSSVPLYMARLSGASGHTAEEPDDFHRFVIYLDPFRAPGRLHAAATLVHEAFHVESYRRRGFHANRAAAALSKEDFLLLGATDELAAYEREAALIASFLDGVSAPARRAAREAMPADSLRWPRALILLLGIEGPADASARMDAVRREIALDLYPQASRYWDLHHNDPLHPDLQAIIRDWQSNSQDWKNTTAHRSDWRENTRR